MSPASSDPDRFIERVLADPHTRRRFLRQGAAGMMSLSALAWLSACGDDGIEAPKTNAEKEAAVIPKGEISKTLVFANWPLYIDVDDKTKKRPSLDKFKAKYGTTVKYVEEVNDNTEFFGKVRQQLDRGDSGGRDLFVVTDWMAARMKRLGYVQKLDKSELPNVTANLLDALKSPGFDPNRDYSVPWQSGQTGLIYRRDKVGGDLKSVNDIFDPKFKGKVTMLSEMRDSVGLVMLGMGKDPSKDGVDAAMAAIDKIDQASRSGHIRRFTGNDYTKDLLKGDSHVVFGWSGDAVQLEADNPDVRFVQPDEGFMLWTDNMQIPVGAPHAFTAQKMIDFVYDPEIQAGITEYVNYVTPVKGVQEIVAKDDPELAESPLIFPSDEVLQRSHIFRDLPPEEERQLDEAFQRVIGA